MDKHSLDLLYNYLFTIHKTDHSILVEYCKAWTESDHSKKTIITHEGHIERKLYFVIDGIQKSYYQHEGKQHIMFFAYPPSFSGIIESFLNQKPSGYFLETISDSRFLTISHQAHEELLKKYRPLETLFRKATEVFLYKLMERQHELLTFSAETRFKKFMERSPHLLTMITQKDLSSYLRIDPTNFSKMINRIKI